MTEIKINVEDELLNQLLYLISKNKLDLEELILKYVQSGLDNEKGVDIMSVVYLNEDVMEKVNIKSKLAGKSPDDIVNDVLWDNLRKIEDFPDDFDGDELLKKLDYDKPEGDDILDRITDMFD